MLRKQLSGIRSTEEYIKMANDPVLAAMTAEGEFNSITDAQYLAAWQYLHDSGLAYKLQGFYGRMVLALVEGGQIER